MTHTKAEFEDGSKISIEGQGKILSNFINNTHVTLQNVLYAPSLKANIMSLEILDEEGYDIHIHKGFLTIPNQKALLLNKVQQSSGRLYRVKLDIVENCLHLNEDISWLRHRRYSHLKFTSLKLLSSSEMVRGLPKIEKRRRIACKLCLFKESKNITRNILVYKDIDYQSPFGHLSILWMGISPFGCEIRFP